MAVDPDVTADFIKSKIQELDPQWLMEYIAPLLPAAVLNTINAAEEIVIADADGEQSQGANPLTRIRLGEIVLVDTDGNTKTIKPTSEETTSA